MNCKVNKVSKGHTYNPVFSGYVYIHLLPFSENHTRVAKRVKVKWAEVFDSELCVSESRVAALWAAIRTVATRTATLALQTFRMSESAQSNALLCNDTGAEPEL